MGFVLGLLVAIFVVVCLLLIVVILLQSSKGEGLASSAFGGAGAQAIFGGRGAATFLSKLTTWLAVAFMVLALLLAKFYGEERVEQLGPRDTNATQSLSAPEDATSEGAETASPGSSGEDGSAGTTQDNQAGTPDTSGTELPTEE